MKTVFYGLHWKSLLLYLEDIIVIGPDSDTHLKQLKEVLRQFQQARLKLKLFKCKLL